MILNLNTHFPRGAAVVATTLVSSEAIDVKRARGDTQEASKEQLEGEMPKDGAEAKVVTVTTTVQDTKEIERLTQENNKLNEEKIKATEELKKYEEEVVKLKEQLDNEKENIIKAQEENSQLGKEKARFEKHATESKQVSQSD